MKPSDYYKDHKMQLLVCIAGAFLFSILLFLWGISMAELVLLWICHAGIVFGTTLWDYLRKRKRMDYLLSVVSSLDQKYLLAELVDKPESSLEQLYFRLMKTALKSMTDEVSMSRQHNREYRDYIEQWIHEIKVPITGIRLLCQNHKSDTTRKIISQTERIGQDVEKVLFYARLGNVEKDYLIREISLKTCVMEALARNKLFFIQNNVCVHTDAISDSVYSDAKWISFILNQILINSVKYQSSRPPVIEITSENKGNYVSLSITDNGIGIRPSEINRVFDKGFVGSNGRTGKNATGIGLYLCKELCAKLGIDIAIESEYNQSTTVYLYFPKNNFLNV